MGKRRKIFVKSVSFGKQGDISRELAEQLSKRVGKQEFSEIIRKALIFFMVNKPEFKEAKIKAILKQRKDIKRKFQKDLDRTEEELNKLDYKLDIGE